MKTGNNNGQHIIFKDFVILMVLISIVVITMAFATLTAQKIVTIAGVSFPSSVIWFSLFTFPSMQIICNLYSKKYAHAAVFAAWIAILFTTVMAHLTISLPAASVFEEHVVTFNFLMTSSLRYFFAASFAFVIAHVFGNEFFLRITVKKHLWLKSTITTVIAQTINTLIFIFAMFIGIASWRTVLSLFIGSMIIKLIIVPITTIIVCVGSFAVASLKESKPQECSEVEKVQLNKEVVYVKHSDRFFLRIAEYIRSLNERYYILRIRSLINLKEV